MMSIDRRWQKSWSRFIWWWWSLHWPMRATWPIPRKSSTNLTGMATATSRSTSFMSRASMWGTCCDVYAGWYALGWVLIAMRQNYVIPHELPASNLGPSRKFMYFINLRSYQECIAAVAFRESGLRSDRQHCTLENKYGRIWKGVSSPLHNWWKALL